MKLTRPVYYQPQTIFIPASVALTIYILFSCLIIPFFRRYHQRYSQYLPLHTISAHTLSLRDRIADSIMNFFLRSRWRRNPTHAENDLHDNDNVSIGDEEGEMMIGMGGRNRDARRREALERRRNGGENLALDRQERLSRELEEGFMDESDDESVNGAQGRDSRHQQEEEPPVVRGVMGSWSRR